MPKTRSDVAALYPRLGLSTIDSTVLRYDPEDPRFPVCFVMTDGEGVRIAWDICGSCFTYVGICKCPNGPQEPAYIYQLRTGEKMPDNLKRPLAIGASPSSGSRTLSREAQARVDAAVADIVGTARAEVREAKRKDAYKPRRPYSPPLDTPKAERTITPETVEKIALPGPCAMHTAESRLHPDGTFTCTVDGCAGVA